MILLGSRLCCAFFTIVCFNFMIRCAYCAAVRFGRVKNNLKMGIVGLPNVGKSSLFNLLCEVLYHTSELGMSPFNFDPMLSR